MMQSRLPRLFFAAFALVATLGVASNEAHAASKFDFGAEDYRLFCGYMDALEDAKIQKLKGAKRDAAIAKKAKMSPRKLMASVNKVQAHNATCEELGKMAEGEAKKAVDAAMPGRVVVFNYDYSDPSHVVAQVTWRGADKKKLVQEAAVVAKALSDAAPFTKTIAIRGVNPGAADPSSDAAMWFEAKMAAERADRIDVSRVKDEADSRYIRLFDGVKCSKDVAAPTALGYRRGPCEGKAD